MNPELLFSDYCTQSIMWENISYLLEITFYFKKIRIIVRK